MSAGVPACLKDGRPIARRADRLWSYAQDRSIMDYLARGEGEARLRVLDPEGYRPLQRPRSDHGQARAKMGWGHLHCAMDWHTRSEEGQVGRVRFYAWSHLITPKSPLHKERVQSILQKKNHRRSLLDLDLKKPDAHSVFCAIESAQNNQGWHS